MYYRSNLNSQGLLNPRLWPLTTGASKRPTPFTNLEPSNTSDDVSELRKVFYLRIMRLQNCEMLGQVAIAVGETFQMDACMQFVIIPLGHHDENVFFPSPT